MRIITVARKPLTEATVAANVLKHGTGALHINAARISTAAGEEPTNHARGVGSAKSKGIYGDSKGQETHQTAGQMLGRWPANLILGHLPECLGGCVPECPARTLDEQSGDVQGAVSNGKKTGTGFHGNFGQQQQPSYGDTGGASRYFKQVHP